MLTSSRPGTRGLALTVAVAVGCLWGASAAGAKTYVVTKRTDPIPGACTRSDCSLREAVRAANAHPGPDRIVLPSKRPYTLSRPSTAEDAALNGDLDITRDGLRIVHEGRGRATIDAKGIDRVFEIFVGAPTRLVKLKITGGNNPSSDEGHGGGIRTEANLWIVDSLVTGNRSAGDDGSGAGLHAEDGKLTILRSSISYNVAEDDSGAMDIGNDGVLIRDSVIKGNRAQFAGVSYMYGQGQVRIERTTIAGNRATSETGTIYFSESLGTLTIVGSTISGNVAGTDGGGLSARNGTVRLINSTVTGNRAGGNGGGIWALTPTELNAVTVARNIAAVGAGLYDEGALFEVENSLIGLNRLTDGTRNDCDGDPIDSLGNNLISTAGPAATCEGFDEAGDLVRSNPRLGLLKRNGGPTKTIALLAGSPARNKADPNTSPSRDQRGVRRRDPDIGAYERH